LDQPFPKVGENKISFHYFVRIWTNLFQRLGRTKLWLHLCKRWISKGGVDLLYNYNIVMELIVDRQGFGVYKIPRGATLFRGDSAPHIYDEGFMGLQDRPTFFGLDKENVEENYGIAYKFVTLVDLNLVALDKNQGTSFYDSLPDEYKQILDENYGYKTGIRDSVSEKDKHILEYICENGYDGYACGAMSTTMGGTFHAEVALCEPASKLYGGECVTDPVTAVQKIDDLKMRRGAPVKAKRQPLRRMESPPRSLFGSPPASARGIFGSPGFGSPSAARGLFDSPPPSVRGFPPKSLFSPLGLSQDDKENTSLFGGRRRSKTKKSTFRKSTFRKSTLNQKRRRTRRNKKIKK
jgi:hypothetical protein